MLKLIGTLIKYTLLSALILILGNWLHWDGRTISDQVKIGMAHTETSDFLSTIRSWAESITNDAKKGIVRKMNTSSLSGDIEEDIPGSERQKLKALIRELNSPTAKSD